jgi:hypothetical protein
MWLLEDMRGGKHTSLELHAICVVWRKRPFDM